jgi:hypothetical protein
MKYIFVGNGTGVPGLPHEISDDEAEALGVTEILEEAVRNGNYEPVLKTPGVEIDGVELGVKSKKKKGVNNG